MEKSLYRKISNFFLYTPVKYFSLLIKFGRAASKKPFFFLLRVYTHRGWFLPRKKFIQTIILARIDFNIYFE